MIVNTNVKAGGWFPQKRGDRAVPVYGQNNAPSNALEIHMRKLLATSLTLFAALTFWAASAAAEVVTNERRPFRIVRADPCTGESVEIAGENHILTRRTVENGTVFLDIHINSHGEGVGLVTGNKYEWNVSRTDRVEDPPGCDRSVTIETYGRLISAGPADNLLLKITEKITFTLVGGVCTRVIDVTIDPVCKG